MNNEEGLEPPVFLCYIAVVGIYTHLLNDDLFLKLVIFSSELMNYQRLYVQTNLSAKKVLCTIPHLR